MELKKNYNKIVNRVLFDNQDYTRALSFLF